MRHGTNNAVIGEGESATVPLSVGSAGFNSVTY